MTRVPLPALESQSVECLDVRLPLNTSTIVIGVGGESQTGIQIVDNHTRECLGLKVGNAVPIPLGETVSPRIL